MTIFPSYRPHTITASFLISLGRVMASRRGGRVEQNTDIAKIPISLSGPCLKFNKSKIGIIVGEISFRCTQCFFEEARQLEDREPLPDRATPSRFHSAVFSDAPLPLIHDTIRVATGIYSNERNSNRLT